MENQKIDIYQMITDKIIKLLEAGIIPWRTHWTDSGLPKNLLTKRPYRGVNVMLLNTLGYPQNYFLTFDQVKAAGGSVRKNEKSQVIIYWKRTEGQSPELRYSHVFNIVQCTGLPKDLIAPIKKEGDPIEACEQLVGHMPNKPTIEHWENRAFYNAEYDIVNVPDIEYFVDTEAYYATLFPQLIHSTGHDSRLNRKELADQSKFGTDQYATEVLIADMGAFYLQSCAGINHNEIEDIQTYIQGWLGKLRHDKRCIIHASALAQRATDYVLNLQGDTTEVMEQAAQLQPATA